MKSAAMWVALYLFNLSRALLSMGVAISWAFLTSLTCLFNAVRARDPLQSTSGYSWHAEREERVWGKVMRPAIDWVFLKLTGEKDHCETAWKNSKQQRLNAVKHMHRRWKRGESIIWRPD